MSDVIENAQNAVNTPASGPPPVDAAEQRRQDLNRPGDEGIWSTDPIKQRRAVDELKALARSPEAVAAEDQKRAEATAKLSPAEQTIATLRKHPAFYDQKHAEHGEIQRQYRSAIFAGMTDEERTNLADAPASEIRAMYGVKDPREILQPSQRDQWNGDEHQVEAVLFLAREGVDGSVIQEMSEHAIKRISAYGGERLPDHEIERFVAKYKGKVSEGTLKTLVQWFRTEVEDGAE
jgi:hypothetical protein